MEDDDAVNRSGPLPKRHTSQTSSKLLTILQGPATNENMVIKKQKKFEFMPKQARFHDEIRRLKSVNLKLGKSKERKEEALFSDPKNAPDDDQMDAEFWANCKAEDVQEDLLNPYSNFYGTKKP